MAQHKFSEEKCIFVSHQSRFEFLLHQRDEGQAVSSLFGRQIIVCIVLLKNTQDFVPSEPTCRGEQSRPAAVLSGLTEVPEGLSVLQSSAFVWCEVWHSCELRQVQTHLHTADQSQRTVAVMSDCVLLHWKVLLMFCGRLCTDFRCIQGHISSPHFGAFTAAGVSQHHFCFKNQLCVSLLLRER